MKDRMQAKERLVVDEEVTNVGVHPKASRSCVDRNEKEAVMKDRRVADERLVADDEMSNEDEEEEDKYIVRKKIASKIRFGDPNEDSVNSDDESLTDSSEEQEKTDREKKREI